MSFTRHRIVRVRGAVKPQSAVFAAIGLSESLSLLSVDLFISIVYIQSATSRRPITLDDRHQNDRDNRQAGLSRTRRVWFLDRLLQLYILPPPGGNVTGRVCLFIYLFVVSFLREYARRDFSKNKRPILMKFSNQ